MKFSTRTRYGLRFLLRLSSLPGGQRVQLWQIAKDENISAGYLEQIVRTLKPAGILNAARGIGGGYRLARAPEEITLEEVFSFLEGDISLIDCLESRRGCHKEATCAARCFWGGLNEHLRQYLRGVTLAQVRDMHMLQDPPVHGAPPE